MPCAFDMSGVEDLFSKASGLIEAESPDHEKILLVLNESKNMNLRTV